MACYLKKNKNDAEEMLTISGQLDGENAVLVT